MQFSFKNGLGRIRPQANMSAELCITFLLFMIFLVSLGGIQPVSAAGKDPASLSLQVSPATVAAGGTVQISTDVVANRLVNIGMLIYRLSGPGNEVHYLEPIIIRDFGPGSSHHLDTDYQVGNSIGDWDVEAYLCIGQCAIKGENPPKNAAVNVSQAFTIVTESAPPPPPPLPPGPGPLQFPR